ncbi:terminase small subunit [Escherichia coli]
MRWSPACQRAVHHAYERHRLTRAQADAQELKNASLRSSGGNRILYFRAVADRQVKFHSRRDPPVGAASFPELENRHVDFLKRDIIKAMNKAAALDELIRGC